jgi:pilin
LRSPAIGCRECFGRPFFLLAAGVRPLAAPWEAKVKATYLFAPISVLLLCACTNEEVTRTKVAEAEATGRQAAQGVENYFKKHRRYPAQLEQAYVRPTPLKEIKLMSVDTKTGVVRVTLSFRPVEGKSLLFVPTRKGKTITWRCTSEDIDAKYLPEACGGSAGKAK